MNSRFETLKKYFDEKEDITKTITCKIVEIGNDKRGSFVPSSLVCVDSALSELIKEGIIDKSGLFLDAGCGDGRIISLAAGVHNIPSVGVEYDLELSDMAKKNIEDLQKLLDFNGTQVKVIKGDFTKDSTYTDEGIKFEDIKTIFNYINNTSDIAKKIVDQSPKGTVFLLFDPRTVAEQILGLSLEKSLEKLIDPSLTVNEGYYDSQGNLKWKIKPYAFNLHVYRKRN